jgi:hypothetical protein
MKQKIALKHKRNLETINKKINNIVLMKIKNSTVELLFKNYKNTSS